MKVSELVTKLLELPQNDEVAFDTEHVVHIKSYSKSAGPSTTVEETSSEETVSK